MLIDGKFCAPVFGLWHDPACHLPPEGHCVLGVGYDPSHRPLVSLIEWEEGDDGEPRWRLFMSDKSSPPPWAWCEVRFCQPIATLDEVDPDAWECGHDPELN